MVRLWIWSPSLSLIQLKRKYPYVSANCASVLECQNSEEKVKVYQSELTKAPYQKRDKKTGKLKQKISKKTEKVAKQTTYSELFTELCRHKKPYFIHEYEVFNDIYHCSKILQTSKLQLILVLIYQMHFSENISQM